jgi:activating signal cointegrator complex subunit 1
MNILQPEIVKIGKRHYRRNENKLNITNQDVYSNQPYEEETIEMFANDNKINYDEEEDKNYNDDGPCVIRKQTKLNEDDYDLADIDFVDNEYYQCKMKVDPSYYGFLIGRNGEKKNNLERETSTRIKIPQRNQGDIIRIQSDLAKNVASCRNRLYLLISSARLQKPFTHLITFPLNFEKFKVKFNEFKENVLNSTCANDRGVSSNIFINLNKLHLTVCVLTLIGDSEIDQAASLLEECRNTFVKEILDSKPLDIHIKGLEYMNDDPGQVDVLYAKIEDSSNRIQQIADKLLVKFVDSGLSKKQFDRVKLHATIMNSLLTKENDLGGEQQQPYNKNLKERESFDARNILKIFGDFDFGVYKLNEIHLSIRFSSGNDSYYDYITKISL